MYVIFGYSISFCNTKFLVSYDNLKIKLKWSSAGVSISPELKLLQYHIGQPLELEEKDVYTAEKSGKNLFKLSLYEYIWATFLYQYINKQEKKNE